MEKRKSKVSNSYRGKASDYYLDCSFFLACTQGKRRQKTAASNYRPLSSAQQMIVACSLEGGGRLGWTFIGFVTTMTILLVLDHAFEAA